MVLIIWLSLTMVVPALDTYSFIVVNNFFHFVGEMGLHPTLSGTKARLKK